MLKQYKPIPPLKPREISRFWNQVHKTDGCWIWTGRKTDTHLKYGLFRFGFHQYLAHRVAYLLQSGCDDPKLAVLHGCDNPMCVRLAEGHLFRGTIADNNKDRHAKGHTVIPRYRGEQCKMAKLTEQQVLSIRAEYIPWVFGMHRLGRKYGVDDETIRHILRRTTWKHI